MKIGYAWVSTPEQSTLAQKKDLLAAGCELIFEDVTPWASQSRPQLSQCLARLGENDVLIVTRLDRIARSIIHLNEVVMKVDNRGGQFRCLEADIDTKSAIGRFILSIMGSLAEFERALIIERTRDGLRSAALAGRVGGNPRFRARDLSAIRMMKASMSDTFLAKSRKEALVWGSVVRSLRPQLTWCQVAAHITKAYPDVKITENSLKGHVKRLVAAGDMPQTMLDRAKSPPKFDNRRATAVITNLLLQDPRTTLAQYGDALLQANIRPPRSSFWSLSSVKRLVDPIRAQFGEDPIQK